MKTVEIQVAQDHLESLARLRSPLDAIEELVWNSIDADANRIEVSFSFDRLSKLNSIRIKDDGNGIPLTMGTEVFSNLGNSPKAKRQFTPTGRVLHGKEGKGRFRAFGLGRSITWATQYRLNGHTKRYNIRGSFATLRQFLIDDETDADDQVTGTEVLVTAIDAGFPSLVDFESAAEELGRRLALHLTKYPGICIYYDSVLVNPTLNESRRDVYPLLLFDDLGNEYSAELTVIEWKKPTERKLYLCDQNGFALEERKTGIQAPGFQFTAYLNSELIRRYVDDGSFGVEGLRPDVAKIVDTAKDQLRTHFRQRAAERSRTLVDQWRKEAVYPYQSEPVTPLAKAERDVFDVCALTVHEYLPEFSESKPSSKRLTFRLIKEAVERSPEALHKIFQQVLDLPKEQQTDLAAILERTRLSAILNAAKTVLDRLDFLSSLDALLFGEFKKPLLERQQFQRILSSELWVFGEQYSRGLEDQSLGEVLKQHIRIMDRDDLVPADTNVADLDGKQRRVDLMLFQQIPQLQPSHFEHLIIELKRPSCRLGEKEIGQIKKYAFAVAADPRFDKGRTKWTFLLVGNELDEFGQHECSVQGKEFGDIYDSANGQIAIRVRKWSTVIAQAKWRHEFYRDKLQVQVKTADGLAYLHRKYAEFLPESSAEFSHLSESLRPEGDFEDPFDI